MGVKEGGRLFWLRWDVLEIRRDRHNLALADPSKIRYIRSFPVKSVHLGFPVREVDRAARMRRRLACAGLNWGTPCFLPLAGA